MEYQKLLELDKEQLVKNILNIRAELCQAQMTLLNIEIVNIKTFLSGMEKEQTSPQ